MRVTHVGIQAAPEAERSGRLTLTPELLAAVGARYSRNNEGLEAILDKVDRMDPDTAVDRIFDLVCYGHASIADMVPVAMFIDGISIFMAYYVWSLCPTASGQESSTRYIRMRPEGMLSREETGTTLGDALDWHSQHDECFAAYFKALALWQELAERRPELCRIPLGVNEKAAARMRRNFAFDRARYFIPLAAKTNVMLIMSARAWVDLCQNLASTGWEEAQKLSSLIKNELTLVAPRMVRHAVRRDYIVNGLEREFRNLIEQAYAQYPTGVPKTIGCADSQPNLEVGLPPEVTEDSLCEALRHHPNRYAWTGTAVQRATVRFSWSAMAMAEIRDLNRHRTGTKYCPLVPQGFYAALDQVPEDELVLKRQLGRLVEIGETATIRALRKLRGGTISFIYWALLGTQFPFEHVTTGNKFIYEMELRTGVGAHYRYAQHCKDMLKLWYERFPKTKGLILEGSAEPE